jgi:hypothetical protein
VRLHEEHTGFLTGPEPVLETTQQPEASTALAFQVQHGIDEMLERLGSCNRSVLGHVTD